MNNKISTQDDLYNRIKPALRTKRHELYMKNIKYVKEIDIWNYNKETKWINAKGLSLAQMVDDILNTNDSEYEKYVLNKLNEMDDQDGKQPGDTL